MGKHSGNNYATQIAMPYEDSITDTELFIRSAKGSTWRAWRRVLHDNNWGAYITCASIGAATSGHNHDGVYVKKIGDVMTGNLYLKGSANLITNSTGNYANGIRINRAAAGNWAGMTIGYVSSNQEGGGSSYDAHTWMIATPANSDYLNISVNGNTSTAVGLTLMGHGNNDLKWNNNTVWHAGNDGSGSGLDADLLDGHNSSYFQIAGNYVPYETSSTIDSVNNANNYPRMFDLENNAMLGYGSYYYILNMGKYSGGNHATQIAMNYHNDGHDAELFIRKANGSTWTDWHRVLHDNNWSSYITCASIGAATSGHNHDDRYIRFGSSSSTTDINNTSTDKPFLYDDRGGNTINKNGSYYSILDIGRYPGYHP